MGDYPATYCNDPSGNCFNGTGGETDGYIWFSNNHNPWHDEYYWLDGEVYLSDSGVAWLLNVAVLPVNKLATFLTYFFHFLLLTA
jgi:hypothetical protein